MSKVYSFEGLNDRVMPAFNVAGVADGILVITNDGATANDELSFSVEEGGAVFANGEATGANVADLNRVLVFADNAAGDTVINLSGLPVLAGGTYVVGSAYNDLINGTAGNDIIIANAGNDVVAAGEGDDYVQGGLGDDIIDASFGNDFVDGQDGNDYIVGGFGDDQLYGSDGDDYINGQAGDDVLDGGAGENTLEDEDGFGGLES